MREKFTPGPWTKNFYYGLRIESELNHGVDNDGWIIAKVEGPDQEANANLIAAAPELYAELKRLDPENKVLAKARGEL